MGKCRSATRLGAAAVAMAMAVPVAVLAGTATMASATSCSTTSGASSCSIQTSVVVTGGTLGLESSPNLFWGFVLNGYDQWASASSTSLGSSCTGSASGTTCSGGTLPTLEVIDASGTADGWDLSEYLSANDLPTGTVFHFDGTGSTTIGKSQLNPVGSDPFSSTVPTAVCDYASTCTVPIAATSGCHQVAEGISGCPSYPVNVAAVTASNAQVDLYSAQASSGMGAICFGSGAASAADCTGVTGDDYYNVGVPANVAAGTYGSTVINLTVSSGP